MTDEKLIIVRTFSYLYKAYLLKGRLENHGVDCWITNENQSYALPTSMPDGIKVKVKASDREKALQIIEDVRSMITEENINHDDAKKEEEAFINKLKKED